MAMLQTDDPFQDPPQHQPTTGMLSTIVLSRDVSLTLATDSIVVLDDNFRHERHQTAIDACCGLLKSQRSINTRSIPFYNVLWAELSDFELTVRYVRPTSKKAVRAAFLNYPIDKDDRAKVTVWIDALLDKAYGQSQRKKRVKVLINPFGGQGLAQTRFTQDIEPILAAAQCDLDVEHTKYSGHAADIAEHIDVDAYDVVACCSGDGVPHEVINGLGRRQDASTALAKIAISQLPCGSGNAMSWNVSGTNSPSLAALNVVKGLRTPLDVASVTQGDRRLLSFLSQAHGMVAEVDLGTDDIRWMGEARFTFGFLKRVLGKTTYPCNIAVKTIEADKSVIKQRQREASSSYPQSSRSKDEDLRANDSMVLESGLPILKYGSVKDPLPEGWQMQSLPHIGTFYAGNMPFMAADANFFQAALPSDGAFDLIMMDGQISRLRALKSLLAVGDGTFFDMPEVQYSKVEAYRIEPLLQPGKTGYISIDGESLPFEPFQVEVHKALATVLSKSGSSYEAPVLQ